MSTGATFESFEKELNRLVESFGKRLAELKQPGYAEAQLRDDFPGLKAPDVTARAEGPGMRFHNFSQGLKGRNCSPTSTPVPPRQGGLNLFGYESRAGAALQPGLSQDGLSALAKLRTATLAAEKAVLQNAVTATDQQIDQLVYELYGLTPEEIALVEGHA